MNDTSNQLLQDILNQQKKQTDLLQQNLGRMRFSLRALLILMTLMAVGLGYVGYKQRQITVIPVGAPAFTAQSAGWSAKPMPALRQSTTSLLKPLPANDKEK